MKKLGRPRITQASETISLRLPLKQLLRLDHLAEIHGSRNKVVQWLLDCYEKDSPREDDK